MFDSPNEDDKMPEMPENDIRGPTPVARSYFLLWCSWTIFQLLFINGDSFPSLNDHSDNVSFLTVWISGSSCRAGSNLSLFKVLCGYTNCETIDIIKHSFKSPFGRKRCLYYYVLLPSVSNFCVKLRIRITEFKFCQDHLRANWPCSPKLPTTRYLPVVTSLASWSFYIRIDTECLLDWQ